MFWGAMFHLKEDPGSFLAVRSEISPLESEFCAAAASDCCCCSICICKFWICAIIEELPDFAVDPAGMTQSSAGAVTGERRGGGVLVNS